jgi:hypothetical protein
VRAFSTIVAVAVNLAVYMPSGSASPNESMTPPVETPAPTSTPEKLRFESPVPKAILDRIVDEAAKLANVPRGRLLIVRAEAVIWNDGSLGCPEPGMQYTQALVNGYWVVIRSAERGYDFRLRRDGSFRLCPEGRGHPPLPSDVR